MGLLFWTNTAYRGGTLLLMTSNLKNGDTISVTPGSATYVTFNVFSV